jgi:hypothetical protein
MLASRLLTVPEAVERYRFPSVNAIRKFMARRPDLPVLRRGRVILIDPVKWDAAFTEGATQ